MSPSRHMIAPVVLSRPKPAGPTKAFGTIIDIHTIFVVLNSTKRAHVKILVFLEYSGLSFTAVKLGESERFIELYRARLWKPWLHGRPDRIQPA